MAGQRHFIRTAHLQNAGGSAIIAPISVVFVLVFVFVFVSLTSWPNQVIGDPFTVNKSFIELRQGFHQVRKSTRRGHAASDDQICCIHDGFYRPSSIRPLRENKFLQTCFSSSEPPINGIEPQRQFGRQELP